MNKTPQVREAVTQAANAIGATDSGVGGQAPASYDVSQTSANDLLRIVPVVLIIIGILLAIMLRSLIAPIYLVLSVLLCYLASLGLAILVFVIIGGDPGLNFVLPFLMFVFLMALGEDYNILVMSRIREEAHDFPLTPAVRRAVQSTGGTVTSAGLILAGTFIVLTITGDRPGARDRPRPGGRHPARHLLRADAADPEHGDPAGQVELVAQRAARGARRRRPSQRRSRVRPVTARRG